MPADTLDKQLRHRVECQLARLCHKHIAASHQKVRAVDCLENILMPEAVDAAYLTGKCLCGKLCRILPVIKMLRCKLLHSRDLAEQLLPDIAVITDIHIQCGSAVPNRREQMFNDGSKNLSLCSRSSDCEKKTHRLFLSLARPSRLTVRLDVAHQLMVDVMSRIDQIILRHRAKNVSSLHAV